MRGKSDEVSWNINECTVSLFVCLEGAVTYLIFPWWIHSKGNRMCERSADECVIPEGNHFPLLHLLLFSLLSDRVSRLMTILLQYWQIAV